MRGRDTRPQSQLVSGLEPVIHTRAQLKTTHFSYYPSRWQTKVRHEDILRRLRRWLESKESEGTDGRTFVRVFVFPVWKCPARVDLCSSVVCVLYSPEWGRGKPRIILFSLLYSRCDHIHRKRDFAVKYDHVT